MKTTGRAASWFFALVLLAGCASTEMTSQQPYTGERLARPDRIIVEDFAATAAEVPADSAVATQASGRTPQTAEDIAVGRKLGAEVAKALAANLRGIDLPGVQAMGQPPPRVGDIVIKGQFVAIDEGKAGRRVLLGFGSGAAELKTAVEVYEMTPRGLRSLARGETGSEGGRTPGLLVPVAIAAATANPLGLIVVGAVKLNEARTGANTIEAAARQTADVIAERLRLGAEKQGWI